MNFLSDLYKGQWTKTNEIKALRVLMGTAVFKRSSLQIGRFLV